jgi:cytochrome c oxidase cbb3-type subunit I/II
LHRTGGKMPNLWHWQHMLTPTEISPGSNMPSYAFLKDRTIDEASIQPRLEALRVVGVPYSEADVSAAAALVDSQQQLIVDDLKAGGVDADPNSELIALIAYLQRLGTHPKDPLAAPAAVKE